MPSPTKASRIKPPALQPGDTVGIVAPASNVKPELLEAGCAALRDLGYKPFYFDSIFERDLYFAGSADAARAGNWKKCSSATKCGRSSAPGADTVRTICSIFSISKKIKAHPKIFVGYSDLTTLLTYFTDATGLDHLSRSHGGQGFCARGRRRSGIPGSAP